MFVFKEVTTGSEIASTSDRMVSVEVTMLDCEKEDLGQASAMLWELQVLLEVLPWLESSLFGYDE